MHIRKQPSRLNLVITGIAQQIQALQLDKSPTFPPFLHQGIVIAVLNNRPALKHVSALRMRD